MKPIILDGLVQIRYLTREQIDAHEWDNCIYRSVNGLIYGYSYYLDNMADNWDALVFYNYDAVMPLPWRKKAGIHYLYQPFNVAQLGVFGKEINKELIETFLKQVPKKFRYWDFPLNTQNNFNIPGYSFYNRMNYVLSLNRSSENIISSYSENIIRNLKKNKEAGCEITKHVNLDAIRDLNKQHNKEATIDDYENFKTLFHHLREKGLAKTYGVLLNGKLLSAAVFFFSHNRAYYILVGNHPDGRNTGASHALIDAFIKDHSEKDLLLDFEGSDIEGLAQFYRSFGAVEEKYPAIKLNRLPWWMKWLKQ